MHCKHVKLSRSVAHHVRSEGSIRVGGSEDIDVARHSSMCLAGLFFEGLFTGGSRGPVVPGAPYFFFWCTFFVVGCRAPGSFVGSKAAAWLLKRVSCIVRAIFGRRLLSSENADQAMGNAEKRKQRRTEFAVVCLPTMSCSREMSRYLTIASLHAQCGSISQFVFTDSGGGNHRSCSFCVCGIN